MSRSSTYGMCTTKNSASQSHQLDRYPSSLDIRIATNDGLIGVCIPTGPNAS